VVGVTGELPLRQRVERHLQRHPDDSVPAIAGALGAPPGEIAEILNESVDTGDKSDDVEETPPPDVEDLPTLEYETGVMPENLVVRDCWMPWQYIDGRKQPHAIYADTENTMSYSEPQNWRDYETVGMACADPRLEGPGVVLQHPEDPYDDEGDPFYIVDYDDVRDPDTGEIHPLVAEHINQADTYADISTSDTGAHLIGIGELPEDVKTIPGESLPEHEAFPDAEIEVYDGKRFVAMTGKHVVDTPTAARESQAFLDDLVDQFVDDEHRLSTPSKPDGEDWEPEFDEDEIDDIDQTDDLQAIVDAIQHVDAHDIRLKSQRTEERADGSYSFDPSWEHSNSGTRLGWDPQIGWIYRNGSIGLDALQVVALEERLISSARDYPQGEDWWDAVDALRDRGAHIPDLDTSAVRNRDDDLPPLLELALDRDEDVDAEPTSALPLEQLDTLPPAERRRAARKRGLDWPSTADAREQLSTTIQNVIRHGDDRVVDAPTSLGKTYTVATTRWGAREDVTGDRPVVHLLETRDARDEAIEAAEQHGGQYHVLRGRHEACPVCAGDHDPREVHECDDEDRQVITVDGEPASQVIDRLCDGKGLPFSVAHQYVADNNDQGVPLPCGGDSCDAVTQWDVYRQGPGGDEDDETYWPLVIATHNFAYAPGLRLENNLVVDELPDYRQDLSTDRIRRAVTAYLQEIDAPVKTWEQRGSRSRQDAYGDDAAAERDALDDALYDQPDREWYLEHEDAHILAVPLARAVFRAEQRANGRRVGKTAYEPPRLDAHAHEGDDWNREWVTVVLDESNDVQQLRVTPDYSAARSVVGLDAHPAEPVWQANTVPWMATREVLSPEERSLWRRYERGLRVVQVGDATRPLSGDKAEEWLDEDRLQVLLEHLREEYGHKLTTAITTSQVEDRLEALMHEAGISSPELMHYGEEKSRNDFASEGIGLVNGCMDPGDDYVLNLLAELNLDAEVETNIDDAGEEYRARGRGFDGANSEAAAAILASVRENHVAQAAGRYARSPDDPDATATVFVRTDAAPEGFVDVDVPGVEWTYTELQREIVDELRSTPGSKSTREIADDVDCSKEHVRETLRRLEGESLVQALDGIGEHGATLYADDGTPNSGVVDVDEPPTTAYEDTSRWSLAIRDPSKTDDSETMAGSSQDGEKPSIWPPDKAKESKHVDD